MRQPNRLFEGDVDPHAVEEEVVLTVETLVVAELVLGRRVRLAECAVGTALQAGAAFVFDRDYIDAVFVGVRERIVGRVVGEAVP